MSIIGLDIGTNACKAIAFDEGGEILSSAAREVPILTPRRGWAEQDAEAVWRFAWEALSEALAGTRHDPPRALALSVQGEAVIPVDRDGRALRHAILGMDTRTTAQNARLAATFGAEMLFNRTGMPVHTINTLPKLLWLQEHDRDVWRAAEKFLLYEDFFLRKLTGQATISHCLASRTQMYALKQADWDEELLSACSIETGRLAALAPARGGVVGLLRGELMHELGLRGGLPLVSGGHDQACAALGSGVIKAGRAMVSSGTAEVLEVAMAEPQLAVPLREGQVSVYRHVVPGLYLAMTLNQSGGLVLRWFRDTFFATDRDAAQRAGRDPYDALLEDAPAGPTDLLLLPHLSGSGTPWLDVDSKGALLGLTYGTTRGSVAKAILEGLTFELRVNLDILREGGIAVDELYAVGGGARSDLWLQLKADICQVPLNVPQVTEAACLGAALLAGVGVGVYPSLEEAVAQAVSLNQRVEPQSGSQEAYQARYALYREVYPTLKGLLHRL
ncbi:MAG: hypothetical protein JXA74_05530 [Anaerolineae bacterium]|nr:hypothetical protein [Anaerolineae bacterium]